MGPAPFFCSNHAIIKHMATYAISDIHGAYEEFQRLLDKIRFQYDGSDSLYLLGDYGDWGAQSMETILEVKRMDEEYDFVHCLMGNHELMFLSAIQYGIEEDGNLTDSARNWLENNRGWVTWNAFETLSQGDQQELYEWLKQLPFSCDIHVDGRCFMAAHAYPFFEDMEYTAAQRQRHKMDAVWRRLMLRENPFAAYTGAKNYCQLICGHTITDYYYGELERQDGRLTGRQMLETLLPAHNRIYRSDKFIDIDCGSKCFDWTEEENRASHAADRAQLAAYCLETGEEFYVARPRGPVGEMMLGESAPSLEPPGMEPPKREAPGRLPPELPHPEFRVPEHGILAAGRIADWAQRRILEHSGEEEL